MACVGHIQKRLGKRLRDLKKKTFVDDSGQVRKIKWGGTGRLTESVINSLSVYFGGAIRNFPGDVDGMFRAIWAVFHHSISDDEQHDHQFFPNDQTHGANSIVHSLIMWNHPSTLQSCQRIWVPS